MGFTLANQFPAIDPSDLYAHCAENNLRIDHWFGKANFYVCPLTIPGYGKLLLSRDTLRKLDSGFAGGNLSSRDQFRTLTISDNANLPITLAKVLLVDHEVAITPGQPAPVNALYTVPPGGDDNTVYLVGISDPRWLYWNRGTPISKNYNLRDPNGSYYTATLNAGTAWTWAQILADIWSTGLTGLGTAPTLPFIPDGTPENFVFRHEYPLNALKYFLDRLLCDLVYNFTADTYSITRKGDTTAANATTSGKLATQYAPVLRYDNYQIMPQLAQYPATLRVEFAVLPLHTDGTPSYSTLDKTVTPAAATINAAFLVLEDDLTDIGTNGAALATRATERATHWTAMAQYHNTALYREYGGIFDLTPALGCYFRAVGWEDKGGTPAQAAMGTLRGAITSIAAGVEWDWRRRIPDGVSADPCCCCGGTGIAPGPTSTGTVPPGGTVITQTGTIPPKPITTVQTMTGTGTVGADGTITGITPSIGSRPCPPGTRPVTLPDGTPACAQVGDLQNLIDGSGVTLRSGGTHPLGGFIGNKARALRGGSAMLSALGLDDSTNGFVGVWDSTLKKWVATDPATFGGSLIVASNDVFAQTTTQTLITQAVGGADGTFRAGAYINVTAGGFGTNVSLAINYTDNNGNAQSNSTALINTVQDVYLSDFSFRAKSVTNITIVATVALGAPTFDAGGTVEKLR